MVSCSDALRVDSILLSFSQERLFTGDLSFSSSSPSIRDVLPRYYSPLSCVTASLWSSFPLLTDMVQLNPLVTQPNYCYWSWCKVFLPGPAKQWIYPAHLITPNWVPKADQDRVRLTILMGRRKVMDALTLPGAERCVLRHDYSCMRVGDGWMHSVPNTAGSGCS